MGTEKQTGKIAFIEFMLEHGKGEHSWRTLADKFELKPNGTPKQKSDTARRMWGDYAKSHKVENFVESARIARVKKWQLPNGEWRESIHYSEAYGDVDIIAAINKAFDGYKAPKPFKFKNPETKENCAIINLFDAHIDKVCLLSETGTEDSSIENNIQHFEGAFDELLASALVHQPELIILPVGSDFFNTNGISGTTKRGTPQDMMIKPEDAFIHGVQLYRRCIDKAAQRARVICPIIKGNHDEDSTFYLGTALDIAYEDVSNVYIDTFRTQRKYYRFGNCLFGFAHGDKEKKKIDHLPLIMAEEDKKNWAETKFREWYLGDIHHKQEYKFLRGKDFIGCMVRFLRSVGTSDKWHADEGYIGIPKTAEVFVWNKHTGLKGNYLTHM